MLGNLYASLPLKWCHFGSILGAVNAQKAPKKTKKFIVPSRCPKLGQWSSKRIQPKNPGRLRAPKGAPKGAQGAPKPPFWTILAPCWLHFGQFWAPFWPILAIFWTVIRGTSERIFGIILIPSGIPPAQILENLQAPNPQPKTQNPKPETTSYLQVF